MPILATLGSGASQQCFYDSLPPRPLLAPTPLCQGQPRLRAAPCHHGPCQHRSPDRPPWWCVLCRRYHSCAHSTLHPPPPSVPVFNTPSLDGSALSSQALLAKARQFNRSCLSLRCSPFILLLRVLRSVLHALHLLGILSADVAPTSLAGRSAQLKRRRKKMQNRKKGRKQTKPDSSSSQFYKLIQGRIWKDLEQAHLWGPFLMLHS